MKNHTIITTLAILALSGPAWALQPAVQQVDPKDVPQAVKDAWERDQKAKAAKAAAAGQPTSPDAPAAAPAPVVRAAPTIASTDADVKKVVAMLTGVKSSPAINALPPLSLGAAVVNVEGLDNAVYFDVARADDLARPFRSGIWHVYKRQGQLRLRQFDVRMPGSVLAFGNMWAAPELFPTFKLDQLSVSLDMPLTADGDGMTATTTTPAPSTTSGATEVTATWRITPAGITFDDKGFDAEGKKVFGSGPTLLTTTNAWPVTVQKRDSGVVVFDIVPPSGEGALIAAGEAAVHYTGWLMSGEQFASSREVSPRTNAVEPLRFTQGTMIPGFNEAILGLTRGTIRRIYIPSAQGYGPRARGKIPANADLVFLVEGLWTGAPKPLAPPAAKVETAESQAAAQAAAAAGGGVTVKAVDPKDVPEAVRKAQAERDAKKKQKEGQP